MASHEWTRVVVLRSATDGVRDERLSAIFAARDWFAIDHTNSYQAMAELCLRERAQCSRAAWGLQRVEKTALVIVEQAGTSEAGHLVQAVRRYLPAVSVWTYSDSTLTAISDPGQAPTAARRDREGAARSFPRPIPQIKSAADAPAIPAPKLHVPPVSNPHIPPPAPHVISLVSEGTSEEPPEPAGRITREEIDMLLRADSDNSSPVPFAPAGQRHGGSGSGR